MKMLKMFRLTWPIARPGSAVTRVIRSCRQSPEKTGPQEPAPPGDDCPLFNGTPPF